MRQDEGLTIGVPVRNESRTLERFIHSLKKSVDFLPVHLIVETIICINGSTDGSEKIAKQLVRDYQGSRLNLFVVYSQEGKMEAQRAILTLRHLQDLVAFFDADVAVHRQCLLNLWKTMEENPQVQVAYARVKAFNLGYETIVEWIESVHYAFPNLLASRKYFHGRGYFFRPVELFFLSSFEREEFCALAAKKHLPWLRLDIGPLVDDIHLSRVLADRYGIESIREVRDAIVEFTAPRTLRDFYHGQRRMLIEIRRLDMLYPRLAYLQKRFERKPDRDWLRQMKPDVRLHHFLYRFMERCIRILVRINIFLSDHFSGKRRDFWVPLESTKEIKGEEDD